MGESQKREREGLARDLRARGATWVEVAEAIRDRFGVNARVAFRVARGWSQQRTADEWNAQWPNDPKTLKNISYWEQWPAKTGHEPSLEVLSRLARIYACRVSDLLADVADHRHEDSAHEALISSPAPVLLSPDSLALPSQAETLFLDVLSRREPRIDSDDALAQEIQSVNFDELARFISMWAQQWNPTIDRRGVLLKLSTALAVAAAKPVFNAVAEEDTGRVLRFVKDPSSFDEAALKYCESVVTNLRRQGDVVGPKLTLQSAMGHRHLALRLASLAPSTLRKRATSVYAELTQLMGWLSFNLGDYLGAQQYYDDARTAAHDAENAELVTYVLCTMSHLATWQGRPRVGIDHAAAAAVWAEQADSPLARAYAADVSVRAYLADNRADKCQSLLEMEYGQVRDGADRADARQFWYFYDESFYWATKTQVDLKFSDPEIAVASAKKSLEMVDPANLHERAHRTLHRASGLIKQENIGEACALIGETAAVGAVNASGRVDQRITALRQALTPWDRSQPVRDLDEILASYRSMPLGSGNT